jgi:hypothetical protein
MAFRRRWPATGQVLSRFAIGAFLRLQSSWREGVRRCPKVSEGVRRCPKVSEGVIRNWWRQGMMGSAKAHYDGIVAFSQTDFTPDLTRMWFPHW